MDLLAELDARGLVRDSTDPQALASRLMDGPIGLYYGCDPSADSLHVGNLIGLVMLRRFQDAGHRAVALAGGATGMVGDPSGISDERNLLDDDVLAYNVASIKSQIARVVDLDDDRGILVDNRDWTEPMGLLQFLRDVGRHATVNQMVSRESVRARLHSEHGITFTEFSYMLLQASDYLWLHDHEGCELQIGGSDQWGNIVSGVDLIRRARGSTVHALAWPLLLSADGTKLGKSTGARTWLDADKTSPYQFHQHWLQLSDDEVAQQLPMFSLRPFADVSGVLEDHSQAPERRRAQRALADEMTSLVHGAAAAANAAQAADVLFGDDPRQASRNALDFVAAEVPSSERPAASLGDVVELLAATGLAGSKTEARRLLAQRSIRANGQVIDGEGGLDGVPLLHDRYLLLRRGRRTHHLVDVFLDQG